MCCRTQSESILWQTHENINGYGRLIRSSCEIYCCNGKNPGRGGRGYWNELRALSLAGLDLGQHLFGVAVGLHVLENVGDFGVRSDKESSAGDAHHLFAIHILFLDHTKLVRNRFILISKERVGQLVLVFELLLGGGSIGGDAEYGNASPGEFAICVAEPARFYRSTGCIGLGVEE